MKSHLILLFFIVIFSQNTYAQNTQYDLGFEYFQQKEYKKALKEFSSCTEMDCIRMACMTQINLGDYSKAKTGLIELKKLDTNSVINRIDADIGLCYYYLSQYDSAIFHFKRDIRYSNLETKFMFLPNSYIGKSYYYLANYDSSTVYLEECILLDSANLRCNYLLSKSYWFQNKLKECFQIIDYTLSYNPEDIQFLTLRGFIMFDSEIEGYLEYYEKAILLGYKPKGVEKKIIRISRKMKKHEY